MTFFVWAQLNLEYLYKNGNIYKFYYYLFITIQYIEPKKKWVPVTMKLLIAMWNFMTLFISLFSLLLHFTSTQICPF